MNYYDRYGASITVKEWNDLLTSYEYKVIEKTCINDDVLISTVWLGMDHNMWPDGPPLIFETMIFGGKHDQEQWRYSTEEQAKQGHREAVKLVESVE